MSQPRSDNAAEVGCLVSFIVPTQPPACLHQRIIAAAATTHGPVSLV